MRPRWPVVSCPARRRPLLGSSPASVTMRKGAEHAGCVRGADQGDGVLAVPGRGSSVAIRTPARKSSPCSASQFLYTVPDLSGTRSTQAGRGMFLPASGRDAGELTRALWASVLVVPHASHRPWAPARLRSGQGSSDAALQARLDMGPHGGPRGCQLSSQSGNGGSLDAQLSDRPADRPHTQNAPGEHTPSRHAPGTSPSGRCVRGASSAVLCHRNLAGPLPLGASITSTTTRP